MVSLLMFSSCIKNRAMFSSPFSVVILNSTCALTLLFPLRNVKGTICLMSTIANHHHDTEYYPRTMTIVKRDTTKWFLFDEGLRNSVDM